MKKVIVFVWFLLFCVQIAYAQQSPCEKTFDSAKQLFAENRYDEAKEKFINVVKNCDFNKEIAQEYITLCEGFLRLKDTERKTKEQSSFVQSVPDEATRRIDGLEKRIRAMEEDSIQRANTILVSVEKLREKNETIGRLENTINEQTSNLNNYKSEREALFSSLREIGMDLNKYLENKLSNNNKKEIESFDTISNDSLVIVLKRNVKLVNEIKAITWF